MTIERLVTSDFMAPSNKFTRSEQDRRQKCGLCRPFRRRCSPASAPETAELPPEDSQAPCNDATRPTPANPMQRVAEVASNSNMLERWRAAHHAHAAGGVVLPSFTS